MKRSGQYQSSRTNHSPSSCSFSSGEGEKGQLQRGWGTNLVECLIPDGSSKTSTFQGTGKAPQVFLTLLKNLGSKKKKKEKDEQLSVNISSFVWLLTGT